mgnify:FL=1
MTHSIATIINFCSNDKLFIHHTINQVKKFSSQIIIPYCDHFYDGTPEDQSLISKTIAKHPTVKFIPFQYDPNATKTLWRGWQFILRRLTKTQVWGPQHWICHARLLGTTYLKKNIKYVLFLDADEVPDGKRFKGWLDTKNYQKYNAIKSANYWYFRSPKHQATTFEDSSLLVKRTSLTQAVFMDHDERNATYNSIPHPKKRMVLGLDSKPMIHHYGWAKPKANLLKKVKTWGHSKDRNWTKLIEKEFQNPFSGTDFIYHRRFTTVKPFLHL